MSKNIFHDIATRTNGEVYIGVVGPVRSGKSTFITRFMQRQIIPKMTDKEEITRVTDELPQSANGNVIMTTQPRFVPRNAVSVKIAGATMKVRMVDCVGYVVPGSTGHEIDGKPRMVKTPWSNDEMPFEKAAELGTKKVIREHSTVAIVMTTDGSITNIARENYIEAEEKTIAQLKKLGKPFVILVNSKDAKSTTAQSLATELGKKHGTATLAINAENLVEADVVTVMSAIVAQFPVTGFRVTMPKWLTVLDSKNEIIDEAITALRNHTAKVRRIADNDTTKIFEKSHHFAALETTNIDMATGIVTYNLVAREDLYFKVLSSASGVALDTEAHLVAFLRHAGGISTEFNKLRTALDSARETGYGIVEPVFDDFKLDRPILHKSGRNFGLKFRATAPSLHLVRVDVGTDVTPSIGTRQHSEEMLNMVNAQFDQDPNSLWSVPIFGKKLESIVQESIHHKVNAMPDNTRNKVKRTLGKVVNQGRGGIICILL